MATRLIDLIQAQKESQEEFLNRCYFTSERTNMWNGTGMCFVFQDRKKEKLQKKITREEALEYLETLQSRPEANTCRFYREGKICDHCGGAEGNCPGPEKEQNKTEMK